MRLVKYTNANGDVERGNFHLPFCHSANELGPHSILVTSCDLSHILGIIPTSPDFSQFKFKSLAVLQKQTSPRTITFHLHTQVDRYLLTYVVQLRVNVAVRPVRRQVGLAQIDLDVVGGGRGGCASLRLRRVQQHLQRGDGVQLCRLLVHFA